MAIEDLIQHWEAARLRRLQAEQLPNMLTVTWWEERARARAGERRARTALIGSGQAGGEYVRQRIGARTQEKLYKEKAIYQQIKQFIEHKGWANQEDVAEIIAPWELEIQDLEMQIKELEA
ncbi:MAG: hypothetical protein HYZ68_05945 [Chloroflexi bacterium]|nr:hypothetical protein [Chloroflexota bacterium]